MWLKLCIKLCKLKQQWSCNVKGQFEFQSLNLPSSYEKNWLFFMCSEWNGSQGSSAWSNSKVRLIRCMVRLSRIHIILFSVCQHIFSQQDMRGTCDHLKKGAVLHTFNLENSVLCVCQCVLQDVHSRTCDIFFPGSQSQEWLASTRTKNMLKKLVLVKSAEEIPGHKDRRTSPKQWHKCSFVRAIQAGTHCGWWRMCLYQRLIRLSESSTPPYKLEWDWMHYGCH